MCEDAKADKPEEIEVTEEMAAIGLDMLLNFEITEGDEEEWGKAVVAVFKAMMAASRSQKEISPCISP